MTDTIAAVSSGRPPAAIAIIRISGPAAMQGATAIAGPLPPPRQASLRALRDVDGALLDRALVLVFPGPGSATGEDLVELHCHGGRAVLEAVEQALFAMAMVRRAQPGEFTRRALMNGRIDLTEAAGLADLLEAETETQRRAAMAAAEGQVSRALRGWLNRVSALSARVEAAIDYADEAEVEVQAQSSAEIARDQRDLVRDIDLVLAAPPVERWRDGIRIVVAGPPNAGKSTLVNLMTGRDASIVSAIAGTTRDRVEVSVRRDGVAYILIDTAGLHEETNDPIERIGIDRARQAMGAADLILWMGDEPPPVGDATLHLHARADEPGREVTPPNRVAVSGVDLSSVEALWKVVASLTQPRLTADGVWLHEGEWAACRRAADALGDVHDDAVLQGEQLRFAARQLGSALGLDATEAMLDALFSRFCLGK